jgi:heat shock transcription factor, other eukaryote
LAKEVLGNYFKHSKFASFVRQLNMYGFHKIPHIHQGVLNSQSANESWEFAHEYFKRGQTDQLMLIERKKPVGQGKEQAGALTFLGGELSSVTQNVPDVSQALTQPLDMSVLVRNIADVRQQQEHIKKDLEELKSSNGVLWQMAMDAREKHQKQQDTVNRIIKFLAGIFGQHSSGTVSKDGSPHIVSQMPGSLTSRFMIEDNPQRKMKVGITEVQDQDTPPLGFVRDVSPMSACFVHLFIYLS